MERFKNYILWSALGALILDILIYSGVVDVSQKQEIETLFQRLLEVLVIAGVLVNPSLGKGLKDK